VAPAPVSPAPPVSGTPAAAPGDSKPTAQEGAATTSTGVDTGVAPKKREEYPMEQILVIKTTSPDHFLTEFMSHVQKPLLAAGFALRTINHLVQSWRPFTKRGYSKRTWAMCFGSVEDTNAAWAEYEGLREDVCARGLRIEKCKPKTKATHRRAASPSMCTPQPNTPELLRRLRRRKWRLQTAHLLRLRSPKT
jgi:hypothetical protein